MSIQEIKGQLAKLLAQENLMVEHRNVETAQFNVDTRVLTLPNWNTEGDVYDLLVGHEVGHALYTPNEDFSKVKAPKSYLNVSEDARIEKLMKRRFPGLAKYFYRGYKTLLERDFFQLKDVDIDTLSFVDRVNLYYKGNQMISFSPKEQEIVKLVGQSETFDDACFAAEEMYRYYKETSKENQKQNKNTESKSDLQSESSNVDRGDDQSEETTEVTSREESTGSGGGFGENITDQEQGGDEYETGGEEAITDEKLQESLKELTSKYGLDTTYIQVPKVNLNTVVVDSKTIYDYFEEKMGTMETEYYSHVRNTYNSFRKSIQSEVNYLVKEFECKKSAKEYARSSDCKTGVLDTSKLHTYKFTEDIFKKITVVPNGKNHGLIFLLDWSGSMGHVIKDTVKQLITLVLFCRKVNIPFNVYGFTYEWFRNMEDDSNYDWNYRDTPHQDQGMRDLVVPTYFNMLNFLSSDSKSADLEKHCYYLYLLSNGHNPARLQLSGTPLNEAVITLFSLIPEFEKKNQVEKTNVVVLTDGESNGCSYWTKRQWSEDKEEQWGTLHVRQDCVLRDRKLGTTYKIGGNYGSNVTEALLRNLSDRYPQINTLGIRIVSGDLKRFLWILGLSEQKITEVSTMWRKTKSLSIPLQTYSKFFLINSSSISSSTELDVEEGAKKSAIKSAFRKSLSNKKLNKKILSEFVSMIA